MLGLRKYTWVGLTSARSNIAYLGEVATRAIFLGVILYIFLQLWRATYAQTGAQQLGACEVWIERDGLVEVCDGISDAEFFG